MTPRTYTAADLRDRLRAIIAAQPYYNVQSRWANAQKPSIRHAAVSNFMHGGPVTKAIATALGVQKPDYWIDIIGDAK